MKISASSRPASRGKMTFSAGRYPARQVARAGGARARFDAGRPPRPDNAALIDPVLRRAVWQRLAPFMLASAMGSVLAAYNLRDTAWLYAKHFFLIFMG